jgi:hypothetical protein
LEILEDRLEPGETLGLGWSALGLVELSAVSFDAFSAAERTDHDRKPPHSFFSLLEAASGTTSADFRDDFVRADGQAVLGRVAETSPVPNAAARAGSPAGVADDWLVWQVALQRVHAAAAPQSGALSASVTGSPTMSGPLVSHAGAQGALFLAGEATGSPGTVPARFAALSTPGPDLPPASMLFDTATGLLLLRGGEEEHTVHEALTPNGFLDVTFDGRHHSSNPGAADFDRALAGARSATLAAIRFDGSGHDTLILDAQNLPGSLAVHATGAEVLIHDVAVAGSLVVRAPQIMVSGALRGGAVTLASAGWVSVEAAGRIDAGQGAFGGRIDVLADEFANSGQLHADGRSGGQIVVQAGNILNAGRITADGTTSGGAVRLAFTGSYIDTVAAVTSASSGAAGPGGRVAVDGGATGRLFSSGRHQATGSAGDGAIDLLGREVVLAGATVDASGAAGGGSVRVGGDFQGRNPAVVNAQTVTVTPATTLRADARQTGTGGRVVVWADQATTFDGTVSARGGPAGGSGGFIEVSSRDGLSYGGAADAGARLGKSGTLLLDPKNLIVSAAPAGVFPQYNLIDPHPTSGGRFGDTVTALDSGNVVVTNPNDSFGGNNAGAAYLFNKQTGALISSLVGSSANDQVGGSIFGGGVTALSNGNYVVSSPAWNTARGAATWASGTTGVSGIVSSDNSLVGRNGNDLVGEYSAIALSNGNYVVSSPDWNQGFGAATWANGATGSSGFVSADNSFVGSSSPDRIGSGYAGIVALPNGNYVITTRNWNGNRGAVTLANGTTGLVGSISADNSILGSLPGDRVGGDPSYSAIDILPNSNYVVRSPSWNNGRGATTWGSGETGFHGVVSSDNSFVGTNPGDHVGAGWSGFGVTTLSNGNYVIASPDWNSGRGAVTWADGATGITGTISSDNSLVGTSPGDRVGGGFNHDINILTNNNYVVASPDWNGGRGAATWASGTAGIHGVISSDNSLVGSNPDDRTGDWVAALTNGNYVVTSRRWNDYRGAATWGNGTSGITGFVTTANSLVGARSGDSIGYDGVTPLTNGNYVVHSPYWNFGRGAATWVNGAASFSGTVTADNSLVGSEGGESVGDLRTVTALPNGNYVVSTRFWNGQRGAVTWGNGTTGVSGTISASNSLVGDNPGDQVGYFSAVEKLNNGNYVVSSPMWNGQRGAVTWANGTTGGTGVVSSANSLVGSNPNDQLGGYPFPVRALSNGDYLVTTLSWNGNRGAVTWANGSTGQTLDGNHTINPQNSVIGNTANAGLWLIYRGENPDQQTFLARFLTENGGRVTVGMTNPNQLSFDRDLAQTMTITPDFLTNTLKQGTAVVLQASNDITINAPITVSAGGSGGALTLQAGRSILLNASITTDNGDLTLIANDPLANGVVNAQRDPGNAVITMAPGITLNTGSAALAVELRDGAGLTNHDSGTITLQTITAGSVSVANNGPSAGSNMVLGPVTTSGAQSYANPNGTATVTGSLTASDSPITFNHAVAVNAGLTLNVGSSAVTFAGTAAPGPGVLAVAGGVVLTGSATYKATLNGTDPSNYSQLRVSGPIDLGGSTLSLVLGFTPPLGSSYTLLTASDPGPIMGTFAGLPEGASFTQGGFTFQVTYQGSPGGNSVVLTRLA